jgi:MFS transporter, DHA1 family, tetracycline resistance protein
MAQVTTNNVSLFPILLVNFIGTLGFSIVIPFLVILVTRFGGNAIIYGLIGATYSLFQFIGAPILGKWSDVHGRRKILLLSQGGTLLAWIIFISALFLPNINILNYGAFTLTLPLLILFFARALDGITGGNVSVANAYLADITKEKDRSVNFGKMSISSNLGFIVGPALAGVLGATIFKETISVLAAIIISVIALIIIFLKLPDCPIHSINKKIEKDNVRKVMGQEQKECYNIKSSSKLRDVWKINNIPFILSLYFILFLGFNIFYASFPIHAIQGLNWTITQMGIFFSILSLMMVVVQGPILKRISKKCSESFLTITGSLILALGFIFFMMSSGFLIYLGAVLFAVGNGIMWPSFLSIFSKLAGNAQGAVQGFGSSAGSLASIIGLVLGGFLYNRFGTIAFLSSSIAIFAVFILSFRLLSMEKSSVTS